MSDNSNLTVREIENIITYIVNEIRMHNLSWDYNVEKYLCFGGCYHFAKYLNSLILNSQLVAASKYGKYDHCVIMVDEIYYDAKGEMFSSKYDTYTFVNKEIEKYMKEEFGFKDIEKEKRLYQIFSDILPGVINYIEEIKNRHIDDNITL